MDYRLKMGVTPGGLCFSSNTFAAARWPSTPGTFLPGSRLAIKPEGAGEARNSPAVNTPGGHGAPEAPRSCGPKFFVGVVTSWGDVVASLDGAAAVVAAA